MHFHRKLRAVIKGKVEEIYLTISSLVFDEWYFLAVGFRRALLPDVNVAGLQVSDLAAHQIKESPIQTLTSVDPWFPREDFCALPLGGDGGGLYSIHYIVREVADYRAIFCPS